MGAFVLLGRPGLVGSTISGIDMALWDALGRLHGVSVCRLLGGSERPIQAYATLGVVDPDRDLGAVAAALGDGVGAVKIMIGVGDLAADVAMVAAVRREIGPSRGLMVDYNQSLTVPEAVRRNPTAGGVRPDLGRGAGGGGGISPAMRRCAPR